LSFTSCRCGSNADCTMQTNCPSTCSPTSGVCVAPPPDQPLKTGSTKPLKSGSTK
jgi:hypothetical protein